jgi:signal transduction histidine kinase
MEETNYLIIGLILGWLALGLVYFVFSQAQRWWRKRQYGMAFDEGLLLVESGRMLTGAQDMKAVTQILTIELPHRMQVERAELLLLELQKLVPTGLGEVSLPVSHAAVRLVASSGEAQKADRGRLQELIQQGRTDLGWTDVWVPLMRGSGLRGMWLLGERDDGTIFAPEDLRWLTAIAREAAAVMEAIYYAEQERYAASEMRELYRQMVKTRESERGRISRELHDGVLQDLSAVTRDLKAQESMRDKESTSFEDLAELSAETVRVLRAICNDLRPPLLQQDLGSVLRAVVNEMDGRSPAPVHIEISAQGDDLSLPDDTALAIFRITQEALNNAIQHADASEIAVRLTAYPDRLRLTVTDDGQGIPGSVESVHFVPQGHYGLAGMRERAAMVGGKLELQTAEDYGTVVIFELPR